MRLQVRALFHPLENLSRFKFSLDIHFKSKPSILAIRFPQAYILNAFFRLAESFDKRRCENHLIQIVQVIIIK